MGGLICLFFSPQKESHNEAEQVKETSLEFTSEDGNHTTRHTHLLPFLSYTLYLLLSLTHSGSLPLSFPLSLPPSLSLSLSPSLSPSQ